MKPSGVFVRHGLSSVPASEEMIRQMIQECDGVAFDKMRCINQELSFVYAENYFKMAGVAFGDNNKRTLKLIDSDGYYTNTALLLSDQCEHSIKCAVYEGTGKTKFKTRKEFSGSILKQLEDAYDFISINNNLNSTIDGLRRTDHPDYPPYAVREALMNAIVHRDYDYSGSTLINIYDDRIEIISLGGLVKGITLKDVMGGISQSRNSILAAVFYRLELIESYGTGIQRIIESYVNAPIKPTFTPNPASFVVTLPQLTSEYTGMDNEDCVLSMINESGYITRKEIECKLGISKAAALDIINRLLEQSKIAKTGSGPNTKYIIRSK
jgi:ATP-dependent DNA helicase RecG